MRRIPIVRRIPVAYVTEVVKELLDKSTKIDAANDNGGAALHAAAEGGAGNIEVVKVLSIY